MFFSKSAPKPDAAFFVWDPTQHSVGVPAFDTEHKQIGELLNQLHAAMVTQRDRDLALKYFDKFIHVTRTHFHHEEQALTGAGYTECESHFAEHTALLREADEMKRGYVAGTISQLALPTFLRNWFVSHIQGSDRKYAACLRRAAR